MKNTLYRYKEKIMGIPLKLITFKEFSTLFSGKSIKYLTKQYDDIQRFGTARQYPNVADDILNKYTPFRRLSKKKCSLSEPNYFIKKFESESANEIPSLWSKMSEENKVDFIVKNRYEKLVSNRIMNDIKNSRVEQSFILSTDGKIKYSGTYNSSRHCPVPPDLAKDSVCIHNHPIQFVQNNTWTYADLPQVNANSRPFSVPDLVNGIARQEKKAYVVDSKGIKFQFIPNYRNVNGLGKGFYIQGLYDDLNQIAANAFDGSRSIEKAFSLHYTNTAKRIKQDGHDFKILNFFNFDKW